MGDFLRFCFKMIVIMFLMIFYLFFLVLTPAYYLAKGPLLSFLDAGPRFMVGWIYFWVSFLYGVYLLEWLEKKW